MTENDDAQQLSDAVQKLRIAYEQYFAGVERFEPIKERTRVKKELRRLMGVRSNNTAYKFKLQSTQATLVTYENHWDRIVRQIEEGTFKRDKLKAQRHLQLIKDVTDDVELIEEAPAPAPAAPPARPAAARSPAPAPKGLEAEDIPENRAPKTDGRPPTTAPRPPAPAAPAAAADPIRKLHEAFVAARAQTGESRPVSFETLAETVRKQTAAVKAQMNCERVEFRVAIKDGKAVLKAIPK